MSGRHSARGWVCDDTTMAYSARALVCRGIGAPLGVETIRVEGPCRDEITIRVAACGVCHSDLSVANGVLPLPAPIILGHEAAGLVVEVGSGVMDYAVGDHVVSSFVSICGHCRYCAAGRPNLCDQTNRAAYCLPGGFLRTFDMTGQPLNVFSGCGVMAEYATLNIANAVPIAADIRLDHAAVMSCAVLTGAGAVFNTAHVQAGSDVAIFGVGGVGINVIQAAAICGASRIIAVDPNEDKRALAMSFGATHFVNPHSDGDAVKTIRELTDGGCDYCFECVGLSSVVEQAFRSARKGAMAIVVGVAAREERVAVRLSSFTFEEKTLTGSYFGSSDPRRDIPILLELYRTGELNLEGLISKRYSIENAPMAFVDLEAGRNARGMVIFETAEGAAK